MKIALIHFQPPEYYPPIVNICNYLLKEIDQSEISLFTNSTNTELIANISLKKIYKIFKFQKNDKRIIRMVKAVYFNLYVTLQLFRLKPSTIFYFETSSSFPAFLYFLFYSKKTRLYIHYHEYTSLAQYKQGMLLDRVWHFFETRFLYRKAYWISQTNEYRRDLFSRDYKFVNPQLLKVLPNFPPEPWIVPLSAAKEKMQKAPYRIIQLGSISTKHMYAREFFNWIKEMNGLFMLDIYSFSTQPDVATYLEQLNCPFIQIKGSIAYAEIPGTLSDYDIGVVLYKAYSKNVVYCASNKLFEYLSGGLDVWVSSVMLGSAPYMRSGSYPKISFVDFENLASLDWKKLIDRDNLAYEPSDYYMERVYRQLTEHFI
ncbi:hypothetical protein [Agriterribacter sp.]|uniref:hypothetical protein n=1 Tax=Agriterribacter sp. TaxID=2821509 RepID=UPI002C7E4BFE|nr:hypothetical protein [Agriterribacter sp.]HTN05245.1 hypothetical protein [Agriterribacter sp.]